MSRTRHGWARQLSWPGAGCGPWWTGRTVSAGNERLMAELALDTPVAGKMGTVVYLVVDGVYAGQIVIADAPKPEAADAITALRSLGVRKTVMLTGDAPAVAESVANELGLNEVHAGLLPTDKVACVEALLASPERPKRGKLAFVGDGINDAPVLTRADVGIAMGAMGSDAAIEAADIVLMDDNPAKVAEAITIARRTRHIVLQNIVFALGVKAIVMLLGATGHASMWAAVFADVGVSVIAILNAMRALRG